MCNYRKKMFWGCYSFFERSAKVELWQVRCTKCFDGMQMSEEVLP